MEHVTQTTTDNCGPTCISILTGDPIPSRRAIPIDEDDGTTPFQLAAYLSKNYPENTTLLSYFNPSLVTSAEQSTLTKDELHYRITRFVKPSTKYQHLNYLYALNYLKYAPHGEFEVAIPTLSYLDTYINKGFHAICLVTTSHFYDEEYDPHDEPFNNHFVVIGKHTSEPATFYKMYDPLCPKVSSIRKDVLSFSMNLTVLKDNCGTGATVFFK